MCETREDLERRAQESRPIDGVAGVVRMFEAEGFSVAVNIISKFSAKLSLTKGGKRFDIDCSYVKPPPSAAETGGQALLAATAHIRRRQLES